MLFLINFIFSAGCRAEGKVELDSPLTVSVTLPWFWWPTWRVQELSCAWAWREPTLAGWAWAETGGKIGNPVLFLWARLSHLGSRAVIAEHPLLGTWHHLIGSSGKSSRQRRISVFKKKKETFSFPAFKFESPLFSREKSEAMGEMGFELIY